MAMEENLNIEYHTRCLVLIALNRFRFHYQAAKALGVTDKKLAALKRGFGVINQGNRWIISESINQMRSLQSVA